MELAPEDARVVACLIEKEANVPDSYPLTLNALRLACNQTSNRDPVVAYDDRRVESSLLSLKSMGLVRFVHPSHGGRTIRYRHIADERWHLSKSELGVLAALVLRGPQTAGEIRSRVRLPDDAGTVEDVLDTLAARSPDPFAVRLERRPGEREARWQHALSGQPDPGEPIPYPIEEQPVAAAQDLARDVAELWLRVERLEKLLGLSEALPAASVPDDRSH